jgi:hypothetical protein
VDGICLVRGFACAMPTPGTNMGRLSWQLIR